MGVLLSQVVDGRSAWAEFYDGVTGAFDANEAAVPIIGLVLVAALVLFLNYRLAVWLARKWSRGGRAGGGRRGGG